MCFGNIVDMMEVSNGVLCSVMLCGFDFHTDELKMCTLVVIVVAVWMRVPDSGFCYVDLTDCLFFVPCVVQI